MLIRWEGARAPLVWSAPAPEIDPPRAHAELARRYLHVFGPDTSLAFAKWARVNDRTAVGSKHFCDGSGFCQPRQVAIGLEVGLR